jgi:hypothetical protein
MLPFSSRFWSIKDIWYFGICFSAHVNGNEDIVVLLTEYEQMSTIVDRRANNGFCPEGRNTYANRPN